MPDVFISYSTNDDQLAQFVRRHLIDEHLNVFLASISLKPGKRWTPQILSALKSSEWVFFLASKDAVASSYVQQELGAALITGKKIVPIMWNVTPSQLPGWISHFKGLDLRGATLETITEKVSALAKEVKADKVKGQLVAGALFAGILYLLSK